MMNKRSRSKPPQVVVVAEVLVVVVAVVTATVFVVVEGSVYGVVVVGERTCAWGFRCGEEFSVTMLMHGAGYPLVQCTDGTTLHWPPAPSETHAAKKREEPIEEAR
jgi:regulator of protease activity HflC (stomatin/prohibitin superfamily)